MAAMAGAMSRVMLAGDDPVKLKRRGARSGRPDEDIAQASRAADRRRPSAAGNPDQAAARPCRRPGRDDGGAEPDDPHRDAGRNRPERRQILAADRQVPIRVALDEDARARPGDDPEPAGADIERRHGAAESRRRHRLRRRARRTSSASTRTGGSSSAPIWRRALVGERRVAKIDAAADHEEPAAGRPAARSSASQKWQAEMITNFMHRAGLRRAAGVRGAGPALPPRPAAVRQHGLAAAGAAGRGDRAAHRRHAGVAAGADRHPDAVRNRRQELDPADRFRDRGNGPGHAASTRRSWTPATSARSRS